MRARDRDRERENMLRRLDEAIPDSALGERDSARHLAGADRGVAVALTILSCLQIGIFTSLAVYPDLAARLSLLPRPGIWPYLGVVACFAPLAWRRRWPVPVLGLVSAAAALYLAMPWPPTIVVAAPMLALYTVASRYGGRRAVPVGIVLFGMLIAVSAMSVSVNYSAAQAVGTLALLALSAALGHGTRTRRELFEEMKRARSEEARRRLEEERLRIAREVHDIMAHSLTLVTVQADAGLAAFDRTPERAKEALALIGDTGRATLRDLRSMLEVLTVPDEESPRSPLAGVADLDALIATVREAGSDVSLEVTGDLAAMPTTVAVSVYRIVQESLTNVVRHAPGSRAAVEIAATPDEVRIDVADEGSAAAAGTSGSGRGLSGMRERVEALGGGFHAGPRAGGGFEVSARIPVPGGGSSCRSAS